MEEESKALDLRLPSQQSWVGKSSMTITRESPVDRHFLVFFVAISVSLN